jgi:hypothetical protein
MGGGEERGFGGQLWKFLLVEIKLSSFPRALHLRIHGGS